MMMAILITTATICAVDVPGGSARTTDLRQSLLDELLNVEMRGWPRLLILVVRVRVLEL